MISAHSRLARLARRVTAPLARVLLAGVLVAPAVARAQVVAGGDFDINDNAGSVSGNRVRLTGRVGFGTNRGTFVLVNAATSDQDVDRDGYTPGVDFTDLVVSDTSDFVNVADPSRSILRRNLVISDFLNPLRNGLSNIVNFYVNVPSGTPAGRYLGRFTITDRTKPPGLNANGEALRTDFIEVEVEVVGTTGIGLVRSDTAATADSLTLRGRPGQTVSGVVRVANLGNVGVSNVRLEVTDLVATSGTGLVIRATQVSFSPATLSALAFADTQRVVVTVRIPLGILAGAYRGELIVQGDGVAQRRVPITVVVTTPGDLVFETNPVVARAGDNAIIIFNADPGSTWQLAIFDMRAITAYKAQGTVFGGATPTTGPSTTPGGVACGNPSSAGDEAVRTSWPLVNGRGEAVAGGMYYVVVNATQCGVRRQIRGKLMVIR